MAFTIDLAPVQAAVRRLPGYAADESDGYDNRYDVVVVNGNAHWVFIATAIESLFRGALDIVRRELAGTGYTLYARYVPGYDDGGEVELLEEVTL